MTMLQAQAVWRLCREGLQQCAADAEAHWRRGEPYELNERRQTSKEVADLIRRSNLDLAVTLEVAQSA